LPTYIQPEQALHQLAEIPLLDARTPAEFEEAHIPGAHNLPLFNNEERAEIGTLYKQVDPRTALLRGLELVGPKMRQLVEQSDAICKEGRVMLHCWRGGQRSGSLGWLLELSGYEVQIIKGGYKAYRRFVQQQLDDLAITIHIVGGPTGTGKTEVLHELARQGEQVIDLEGLANHKGSSFGALGESPQPSVTHFENMLYQKLTQLDLSRRVWLEDESRMIGHVCLPEGLWQQMANAPIHRLDVSLDARLDRLVAMYAQHGQEDLKAAFERIGKRLGGQRLKKAIHALETGNYKEAARLALAYYDKAYHHHTEAKRKGQIVPYTIPSDEPRAIAEALIESVNQNA
jgi:tRNA 2-selenouridine synthase